MRQVLRQGLDQSTWQKFSLATAAHEALGHLDRTERLLQQFPTAGLINAWSGRRRNTDQRETAF